MNREILEVYKALLFKTFKVGLWFAFGWAFIYIFLHLAVALSTGNMKSFLYHQDWTFIAINFLVIFIALVLFACALIIYREIILRLKVSRKNCPNCQKAFYGESNLCDQCVLTVTNERVKRP